MWGARSILRTVRTLAIALALTGVLAPTVNAFQFRRGDANLDDEVNLTDAITILGVLFAGVENPGCDDARDADDDGQLVLSDAIYLLNHLFAGGAPPPAPFPDCGDDPTPDGFACEFRSKSCDGESECFGDDDLTLAINQAVNDTECVEGDGAMFQIGEVTITVCPAVLADVCDGRGNIGCPVFIDPIVATIELEEKLVAAEVTGRIVEMPILLVDAESQEDCLLDIDFFLTAHVEFETAVNKDGDLVVDFVTRGYIADHEAELFTEGSFLCKAIQAAQGLFIDQIVAELEAASDQIISALTEEVVGKPLCTNR